jgi:hypothetical protein
MSLVLSGSGVVTGLDSLASSDLGAQLGSKLDLAGGKILQIVRATDATNRTTTSTSFVDANLSVTISPQKNDSAVLLIASVLANTAWSVATEQRGSLQITDNSNNPISGAEDSLFGLVNISGSGDRQFEAPLIIFARATPATINATTFKLRFRTSNASTQTLLRNSFTTAQLYAIEVSA